jgi:hypothetical protein
MSVGIQQGSGLPVLTFARKLSVAAPLGDRQHPLALLVLLAADLNSEPAKMAYRSRHDAVPVPPR